MQQYKDLVQNIIDNGDESDDRTGVGTKKIFGAMCKYDLRDGFPLVTLKKTYFDSTIKELLWFLSGDTNANNLDCKIWDDWSDEDGELGDIYSKQWRRWDNIKDKAGYPVNEPIDQISNVIEQIKTNPNSRRLIVSAWNPAQIETAALPPCHTMFQFAVIKGRLDCMMTQRSNDVLIGVPFNIASYALLMHMIANECGLEVGVFTHSMGDVHIYKNHLDHVDKILSREPLPLPSIELPKGKAVLDIVFEDVKLIGYEHHPFIKLPIAV